MTRPASSRSAKKWVTLQIIFEQIFWVLLFAVQAPLLGPRPFGLIALATVVVGFCEGVLIAVGTDTLISIREIEDLHYATLTTVNIVVSAVLAALLFVGADSLASLFHDAELAAVLRWMAFLPLISSFWVAPASATKRLLLFKPTAVRSIVSLAVSGAAGLALALAGAGVWALVWQALLQRLVGAVALWMAVPLRFRLAWSGRHLAELRRIALPLLLGRSMSWFSGQSPRFILGLFLTTSDIGLYNLGTRFKDLLVQVAIVPGTLVARVDFRRFAPKSRDLDEGVSQLLLQLGVVSFPLCIGGAVVMPTLFGAWLDSRWQAGIVSAQMLLLSCIPCVTLYCATAVLLSQNRRNAEAVITTVLAIATAMATLAAARLGLNTASACISLTVFALLPVAVFLMRHQCGIRIRTVIGSQLPALASAVLMGLIVWVIEIRLGTEFWSPALMLLILVVSGALVYAASICVLLRSFVTSQIRHFSSSFRRASKDRARGDQVIAERASAARNP
jgi:PST family polysaccharide transporter